jgi:saccharopine dehydrogenase (NAD+, L-lysine-forming)
LDRRRRRLEQQGSKLSPTINDNQLFITDGGYHPGLPAAMIRHVCSRYNINHHHHQQQQQQQQQQQEKPEEDEAHQATSSSTSSPSSSFSNNHLANAFVTSLMRVDWKNLTFSTETETEFIQEMMTAKPSIYRKGQGWVDLGMSAYTKPLIADFGTPFGKQECIPMYMPELDDMITAKGMPATTQEKQNDNVDNKSSSISIPQTLDEVGFYIAGFNHWWVDMVVLPFILVMLWLSPASKTIKGWMGRLFMENLQRHSSEPPFRTILKVDTNLGTLMTVSHDDAYVMTGVPAAATIIQYVTGRLVDSNDRKRTGLHFQGCIVDTEPFFNDMEQMGIKIQYHRTIGASTGI